MENPPRVSVIIPSLDGSRGGNVERLLSDLKGQTFRDIEIKLVKGVRPNGKARNTGAREAKGRVLVFMDDDVRLGHNKVLENLIRCLENDEGMAMAGASVKMYDNAGYIGREYIKMRNLVSSVKDTPDYRGRVGHACLAVKKSIYDEIGGESEDLITGTDVDLNMRLKAKGYRVAVVPDTWVYHLMPDTMTKVMKDGFKCGFGLAYAVKMRPEVFGLPRVKFTNYTVKTALGALFYMVMAAFIKLPFYILTLRPVHFVFYLFHTVGFVYGWAKFGSASFHSAILFITAIIPPVLLIIAGKQPFSLSGDQIDFHKAAAGLLDGKGPHFYTYIAGNMPLRNTPHPLYPLFIAIIYFFTGHSIMAVRMTQVLLHALTCVLIYLISEKLFKNRFASFGVGVIWALYPAAIQYASRLLSETLFTFLLAASVYFILRSREDRGLKNSLLAGLSIGLAALTKSVILAFIPLLFLWMILFSGDRLALKLKAFLIIILFAALTVTPWLIRNSIVLKSPFTISTTGGISFYRYNNEKAFEAVDTPLRAAFPLTESDREKISGLSEVAADRYFYDLGWQFIRSHPGDAIRLKLKELSFFWRLWPASARGSVDFLYILKILYHLPYDILFAGMFVSFIVSFRRYRESWENALLLILLIVTINAVYIFHHGADRYRVPIDPYVFILGFHGLVLIYNSLKRREI